MKHLGIGKVVKLDGFVAKVMEKVAKLYAFVAKVEQRVVKLESEAPGHRKGSQTRWIRSQS